VTTPAEDDVLFGPVQRDRIGNLEAELAQTKATLLETRGELLNLEAVTRDLGGIMLQALEANKDLAVEVAKLTAHAGHDEAFKSGITAVFCPYCNPLEGS
jgi:hypothetical protein